MAKNKLTTKETLFVQAYTTPDSPTLGCAAKAYRKAYPSANDNTARKSGAELVKKPKIRTAIEEAFDRSGLSDDLVAETLRSHVKGPARRETRRYSIKKDGAGQVVINPETGEPERVLVEIVESSPSFRERQQAIDLKARLLGHYEQTNAIITLERDQILREMMEKQGLPTGERNVTPDPEG